MTTVGSELAQRLRGLGVERLYGPQASPLDGLTHVAVGDAELACLLADLDGRLGGGVGAALLPDGVLHLSSRPAGQANPRTVRDVGEALAALAELDDHRHVPTTAALHLDLDLDRPVEDELPEPAGPPSVVVTLDPDLAGLRIGLLVGPGVSRGGYTAGLLSLCETLGVAALNTWGAKGVFRWDSPYHAGTGGLQARDLELAGLNDVDLLLTSGLDPDEGPAPGGGSVMVQDAAPWQLAALTHRWAGRAGAPTEPGPLYRALSEVVVPLYESTAVPLSPARAALHLSGARPEGGVVVGEAGAAGFWLARTYPTGEAGSVVVPATGGPGTAVAGALAAALAGRPAVAVVDELDPTGWALVDLARSLGVAFGVQVWSAEGEGPDSVEAHARLSEAQFAAEAPEVATLAVDHTLVERLVEVAGPVTAWGGIP